jgi:hypothetical protein
MLPTTWLGTDEIGRLVFGGFRDFDRRVLGFLDADDAASAAIESDLLGSAAGQVDQRTAPATHMVVDGDDDGAAGFLHGDADPRADRQMVARGGHGVLVEHVAAAGAAALVVRPIPCRHPGVGSIGGGWQAERHGRSDDPWQATLNWHGLSPLLANP